MCGWSVHVAGSSGRGAGREGGGGEEWLRRVEEWRGG